jgi:hypothetical protein
MPLRTSCLTVAALLLASASASPQTATAAPTASPSVIEVDGACRILNVNLRDPAFGPPKHPYSSPVCNIESEKVSQRWEQYTAPNGTPKNRLADIHEKDFVLQNPYSQPITFLVHQPVPKNFHIDSPPPPTDLANSIATFKVVANPGQTVRVHVGWRD